MWSALIRVDELPVFGPGFERNIRFWPCVDFAGLRIPKGSEPGASKACCFHISRTSFRQLGGDLIRATSCKGWMYPFFACMRLQRQNVLNPLPECFSTWRGSRSKPMRAPSRAHSKLLQAIPIGCWDVGIWVSPD